MNEIKEINQWRDIPCSWIRRLPYIINIVKATVFFPTRSIDSMQSQSKYQQVTLWISTSDSKVYMDKERPRITNIMFKKNRVGGLILPNYKSYCKAAVIKTI